jgi:hypothetical protein
LSGVEVEDELGRMRSQADDVGLVLALVGDPACDQLLGEDVALEQKLVVGGERVECTLERSGDLRDGVLGLE